MFSIVHSLIWIVVQNDTHYFLYENKQDFVHAGPALLFLMLLLVGQYNFRLHNLLPILAAYSVLDRLYMNTLFQLNDMQLMPAAYFFLSCWLRAWADISI